MLIVNFHINNWAEFNPRADRKNFSWFRFENTFFTNPKLFSLDIETKMLLIFIFCEASKKGDGIGCLNVGMATAMTGIPIEKIKKSIQLIENTGVATFDNQKTPEDANVCPTNERTDVTNETNERDETNETSASGDATDLKPLDVFNLWNSTIEKHQSGLSKAKAMNPKRIAAIKSCIKTYSEMRGGESWATYFKTVNQNNFLCGINDRNWKADFDWIINKNNLLKVVEGRYDNLAGSRDQAKTNNMKNRENPYAAE